MNDFPVAYYNENDPFAAAWLRKLIDAEQLAFGIVDERSIEDVEPTDLEGYTQCHFFAGIGVWSYSLRRAGWVDARPVWTGSCPCQPFSAAGKRGGVADERHLWPAWFHLIQQCRPVTVFGEQVASKDGLAWLDIVQSDLEATGYTVGAADICAAGFGAPHIRQRLYFVAESSVKGLEGATGKSLQGRSVGLAVSSKSLIVAESAVLGRRGRGDGNTPGDSGEVQIKGRGGVGGMVLSDGEGSQSGRIAPKTTGYRNTAITTSGAGSVAQSERDGRNERWAERKRLVGESASVDGGGVGSVAFPAGEQEQSATEGRFHTESCECGELDDAIDGGDNPHRRGNAEAGSLSGINRASLRGGKSGRTGGDEIFVGNSCGAGREGDRSEFLQGGDKQLAAQPGAVNGFWRDAEWLPCTDGKARPVEPGASPLVDGTPNRVGRLRGYGNAIVAPCAEEWVRAYMSVIENSS